MLSDKELGRELMLDGAVQAGKISPARVPLYREMYDQDPDATARLLTSLAPVPASVQAQAGIPSETDMGKGEHVLPAPPSLTAPSEEQVSGWTQRLFPEVARKVRRSNRITKAD